MEDYKRKLELAKERYNSITSKEEKEFIESLFPELKESEDEKIRKDIVAAVETYGDFTQCRKEEIYTWLEKQGEQKPCMIQWKGNNLKEIVEFTGKSPKFDGWFKSWDEYENYVHNHNNIFKLFNEDGSHYEVPVGAWIVKTPDGYNVASKAVLKQKPADKVEPKFKVGDWVRAISSGNIFKILSVNDRLYRVLCYDGVEANYPIEDVDYDLAYWTIQDAKDGDVLTYYLDNGKVLIMIYECLGKSFDGHVNCHALLDGDYFSESAGSVCCKFMELLTPSTKEQRDLLFQKMKEAGYKWDTKKKELKKIEQKLVDKIEPKFNVGDWVMLDRPVLITKVEDMPYNTHQYWTSDGKWFGDATKAKLWTIQDAKDGDVLAEHETIVLFKKIEGQNIRCYCTYHYLGFNPTIYVGTLQNKSPYCPATKEQSDLLFQKMKEIGYEWDAKKKELRLIEQSCYHNDGLYYAIDILEKTLGKVEGYQSDDGKMEHQIAIETVNALYHKKPAEWSEEDREMLDNCLGLIQEIDSTQEEQNWLKTLKDRQPQPTSEWGEEDEKHYQGCLNLMRLSLDLKPYPYYNDYLWLKSLKDKVQPQPKQTQQKSAWSEEDEYQFNTILHGLDLKRELYKKEGNKSEEKRYSTQYNWLKSLKPQNHWKPSEEQMKGLNDVIETVPMTCRQQLPLESLYNDLKKL